MPKGKILMGKTPKPVPGGKPTPGKKPITRGPVKPQPVQPPKPKGKTKPVVPPKPKGKNPPSVVYKKVETFKKNEARPYATARNPLRTRPEGVLMQAMPSFLRKTKPITRRGGK